MVAKTNLNKFTGGETRGFLANYHLVNNDHETAAMLTQRCQEWSTTLGILRRHQWENYTKNLRLS